jgi:transcriptional regulator with XRE-family HTH domain
VPSEPEGTLGPRLREARQERGLTISQLAAATGLTSGFISLLERDLSSVSLSSLARICTALGLRFGDLLDEPTGPVVRREEARRWEEIGRHDDRVLSPGAERRLHLIESRIPPGVGAGDELYTLPADVELVHVRSGMLEMRVGDTVFTVGEGDTLSYSPRESHTWRNPSEDETAVVLWFAVPNPY